jgi:LmbE family N-acetylglucosaminyl deacetylase
MMAGTLILLGRAGYALHYMNIGNGSCGTISESVPSIVRKRRAEAREACRVIGATYYPSLVNDLEIYHTTALVSRVVSVIRRVRPRIMLVPSPQDYMEDHANASGVAVTAAFARGMPNYPCRPFVAPVYDEVEIYHALPYGLRGPLRERIRPGLYVDVTDVLPEKRAMLACHRSQKEWLDESQGLNAYLDAMESFAGEVGRLSGKFSRAEGWRRRSHLGFSKGGFDPLAEALGERCLVDRDYERALEEG